MTRDRSLFKVFESKKGGNVTLVMGANHRLKERNHLSTWTTKYCKCSICRRSESELVEHK